MSFYEYTCVRCGVEWSGENPPDCDVAVPSMPCRPAPTPEPTMEAFESVFSTMKALDKSLELEQFLRYITFEDDTLDHTSTISYFNENELSTGTKMNHPPLNANIVALFG